MKTNSGMTIPVELTGRIYPLDGRKETHPDWMAGTIRRLDPFQDAVPCDSSTIQQIMCYLEKASPDEYMAYIAQDAIAGWGNY